MSCLSLNKSSRLCVYAHSRRNSHSHPYGSMVWFKLVSFNKLIVYQLFNKDISSANVYIFLRSMANFSALFVTIK